VVESPAPCRRKSRSSLGLRGKMTLFYQKLVLVSFRTYTEGSVRQIPNTGFKG
jgi:hypothetical protein